MSMWDFTPSFDNPVRTEWPAGTTGFYNPATAGPMATPPPAPAATPGPATPAAAPSTTPASAPTADQLDARAQIDSYLHGFGLDELSGWAWQQIVNGATASQITLQLYDRTSEPGKVVAKLYPEVFMRMDKGLPPMSIGDAVTYRNNAIQMFRAAGLPDGFYDQPEDLAKFAGNDVSLAELKDRLNAEMDAAVNAAPEVTQSMQDWGMPVGSLAAFFLDPERALPLIQRQYQAAQLAGVGRQTGYASLSEDQATRLAQQGVTADQARQGFSTLAGQQELYQPLPGEQGNAIGIDEQMAATFSGDAAAQRRIRQRQRERVAAFAGGGNAATDRTGISGLGTANT